VSNLYKSVVRPLLFALPGEASHELGKLALHSAMPWRWFERSLRVADPRLKTRLGGLELDNPVGLSAGFDKNAEVLTGLQRLGFGYVTVGSILPEKRSGNPKPRLMRYPAEESLRNCYGLPSLGLEACVQNLAATSRVPGVKLVANIDAPTVDLYLASFEAVQPYVDAVELGLQCPNNTDDDGSIHEPKNFERLLQGLSLRRQKPILVKTAFYDSEADKQNRLELMEIAIHYKLDAIVTPGIWKMEEPKLSLGVAATSGKITFERNLNVVRTLAQAARGRIAIKSNGGIFSGADAFAVLSAGASSVDLLSGFIYEGWEVAAKINRELLAIMDEHRISDIAHLHQEAGVRQNIAVGA
jgi:dihydroorotate dehydrogenase